MLPGENPTSARRLSLTCCPLHRPVYQHQYYTCTCQWRPLGVTHAIPEHSSPCNQPHPEHDASKLVTLLLLMQLRPPFLRDPAPPKPRLFFDRLPTKGDQII